MAGIRQQRQHAFCTYAQAVLVGALCTRNPFLSSIFVVVVAIVVAAIIIAAVVVDDVFGVAIIVAVVG